MENIKDLPETTVEGTPPKELYAARASKSFQDFIKVLSQIIEKHGADVLDEISRVEQMTVLKNR